MTLPLEGRHALVTGGGRGIGRAIAAALTAAGARVAIVGRSESSLADAVADGAAAEHATADVTDEEAFAAAVQRLAGDLPFTIAVANAGAVKSAPFRRSDAALFRRMLELNLIGVVSTFQAVLPGMVAAGHGRLIALASTAGHRGYPYVSAYCAAKHAVIGLVKALALESARSGVTVNAICPGYTDTDMVAGGVAAITAKTGKSPENAQAELVKDNPQGRLIRPDEVATAALYLCLPGADAVTGQSLILNGGEF